MEPLLPEQNKQLLSWASQRDSILLEIAQSKTESEKLIAINRDLSSSNTEIADRIQQSLGRIEELTKKEKDLSELTTVENARLSQGKSVLQSEVAALYKEISLLKEHKDSLVENIDTLVRIHDKAFATIENVEQRVGYIAKISSENAQKIETVLSLVEEKSKDIVAVSTANIAAHTHVLTEIPRLFVELKRQSMDRDIISKHKTHE